MPSQGIQYRSSHGIPDEALLGMVMTEPRPPRPNSIELRRSYPPEEHQLYSPPMSEHYRTANYTGQVGPTFSLGPTSPPSRPHVVRRDSWPYGLSRITPSPYPNPVRPTLHTAPGLLSRRRIELYNSNCTWPVLLLILPATVIQPRVTNTFKANNNRPASNNKLFT
jgi:hypothetical protein